MLPLSTLKLNARVLKQVGLIATNADELSITRSGVDALDLLETLDIPKLIPTESIVASEEVPL